METASSEQELSQLLDEGKINNEEYDELLGAMKVPAPIGKEASAPQTDTPASKQRLGKIAFYLMLAGIALTVMVFLLSLLFLTVVGWQGKMEVVYFGCLILCALIQIPAFVFGVISWPDVYGKAAATTALVLAVLVVILFVLTA